MVYLTFYIGKAETDTHTKKNAVLGMNFVHLCCPLVLSPAAFPQPPSRLWPLGASCHLQPFPGLS